MGSGDKERDGEAVDASVLTASEERPREKRPKSRSDRDPDRERHRERTKGERRERKDRDRDKDRDGDGHRHHKSSSTRSSRHKSSSNPDGDSRISSHSGRRRHRTQEEKERDRAKKSSSMTDLVPELSGERISMPYPNFSKAHSKESVRGGTELDMSTTETNKPATPEATDLGGSRLRSKSVDGSGASANSRQSNRKSSSHKGTRPPSPPETDLSEEKRRSTHSSGHLQAEYDADTQRPKSRASGLSRSGSKRSDKSRPSSYTHRVSDERSTASDERTAGARSEATSVAPKRVSSRRNSRIPSPMDADDSPDSVQDSSPKTPNTASHFPHTYSSQKSPSNQHFRYSAQDRPTPSATPATDFGPPPPPPPPPGSMDFSEVPRVDYLLQHGGLSYPVSKNFLSVVPRNNGTRPSNPPLAGAEVLFAPFFNLLGQYENVIHKQGSVAVATGHKSVARRLLDRLEDVFSRDLPEEGCNCVMCESAPDRHRGLGWGEVLERVGGRVEMPPWPPFDLASIGQSAAEVAAEIPPRPASPVKLDPDIAEEFREHYLRQSKKVKAAVDKWMNNCDEAPAPPPTDVDDETLAFAILTNLDREDQPYFNALLTGTKELHPTLRAPTPMLKTRTDFMVKTGLALQRVYRLQQAPRDAETAMYLVKNPAHHDLLATITDISPQEWEILISGRFDGFLWSGADAEDTDIPLSRGATPNMFSPPPSRGGAGTPSIPIRSTPGFGASRNTTPFSGVYSRGPTPSSFISLSSSANSQGHNRQAVSHDEELEMAVLAEVEREIYQGMEALEDAFEKLHHRAEVVRNALRQRNTGLSMNMQNRRGIDVLPESGDSVRSGYQRPPWAMGDEDGGASESDWGGDDFTDLAPEDSASNVSSSRHRRPKRRTERRTPAPIEEEDEG